MEVSVYESLTKLCENVLYDNKNPNHSPSTENVKRLRAKCYEILLSKNCIDKPAFPRLENIDDVECNLLAWQLYLIKEKGLPEHALKLSECITKLNGLNITRNADYQSILNLLIDLQVEPSKSTTSLLDVTLDRWYVDRLNGKQKSFDANKFKLPAQLVDSRAAIDAQFQLNAKQTGGCASKREINSECDLYKRKSLEDFKPAQEVNIWEEVLKRPPSNRKLWENLGCSIEEKEQPFLGESDSEISTCLNVISPMNLALCMLDSSDSAISTDTIPLRQFVVDIKYLLVGVESRSFIPNDDGNLQLAPEITVHGLSVGVIKGFCKDPLLCFASYRGLHKLSTPDPFTGKLQRDGYIFTELCESIRRYLSFYRIAVLSIPDTTHLLSLHSTIRKLSVQIKTLASVCRVGPYRKLGEISHGISLLNHLYQELTSHTNKDILMVLYAIFYPCYQVYFNRFLQQWILGGSVVDPYEEFFVQTNCKYLNTHGRTFWTRSYSLRENIVPDFLSEMQNDVLYCGKAMNLLKLCVPSSPLCLYLMGKTPCIFSCCLTSEQLTVIEKNNHSFHLEVCTIRGPRFTLKELLERGRDTTGLAAMAAKKRAATLNRINLERRLRAAEEQERKKAQMEVLREQYMQALLDKQVKKIADLEEELHRLEKDVEIKEMRDKLVEEEANNLIDYYNSLFEAAERRRLDIVNSMEKSKKFTLEMQTSPLNKIESDSSISSSVYHEAVSTLNLLDEEKTATNVDEVNGSDEIRPVEVEIEIENKEIDVETPQIQKHIETVENTINNLDLINANVETTEQQPDNHRKDENFNLPWLHFEPFEAARRNRTKVMSSEFNIIQPSTIVDRVCTKPLTEAQRNKQRVLSSEYNLFTPMEIDEKTPRTQVETAWERNRDKVMGVNECFRPFVNEQNREFDENLRNIKENAAKLSLSFNFDFIKEAAVQADAKMDADHVSVGSSARTTPFRSEPWTCSTATTEFNFELDKRPMDFDKIPLIGASEVFSKRVNARVASTVSNTCLDVFLKQGICIPLATQTQLVNAELLHYFLDELQYLSHLNSLRNYFFLLDGEFGRIITDTLFARLYDVDFPVDLINCRTLHMLAYNALDYSTKFQANAEYLSFKINNMPKVFNLGDPDVLDCISLTYKVGWPLNILLPSDTIAKYDVVFKFLLKLERVSWVTQAIFHGLKLLVKQTESKKVPILMICPQYRALHQYRHFMSHFILTLRNYIVGEVLQSSWEMFESKLAHVTNIDQLYTLHTDYIKNILFMCLLNQRATPLRKCIHKILIVILKFYDYMRTRLWEEKDGVFTHPNFAKLTCIYENFKELVQHFFKIGQKVVRSGYQPHLLQLLDMLDLNRFYRKDVAVIETVSSLNCI